MLLSRLPATPATQKRALALDQAPEIDCLLTVMASRVIRHTLADSESVELVDIDRNAVSRLLTGSLTDSFDAFHSARLL